ncbi:MAG: redox-sensing transcriptional repressor Rex [Mycobacteriaceae bacterium]|nr:redox-sensing transcriptional repressor Rex [Mycobacteriaceae bacterium]
MTEQQETRTAVSGLSGRSHKEIPQATVARLAVYLRVLGVLLDDGTAIVSSEELAAAAGVGSAKLRKDLSFLGPNGVRGVGYDVAKLLSRIEGALGVDRGHRVVMVGVGHLGRALAAYGGFGRRGFTLVGLFDSAAGVVGEQVAGLVVRSVAELASACAALEPTVAVVAVPDTAAQSTCDALVQAGVRGILNFTSVALEVPERVSVRHVDLAVEMQMLSFDSARQDSAYEAEVVELRAAEQDRW